MRIDVALEGNWSSTVRTVWTRSEGRLGFESVCRHHAEHRPCLELNFSDGWLGLRCFQRSNGLNVFDEALALNVIGHVESKLRMRTVPQVQRRVVRIVR